MSRLSRMFFSGRQLEIAKVKLTVLIEGLVLILQRLVVAEVLGDLLELHGRLHRGFDTCLLLLVNLVTSAHNKGVKGDGARTYLYS